MSKYLITGTAGFIGFHLANALLEKGEEVVGLDNINDYYDVNLKYARLNEAGIERAEVEWYALTQSKKYPGYRFIHLNLEDKEGIMKLFRDEQFDYVINLAAQAGVRYCVDHPVSLYAATKKSNELMALTYGHLEVHRGHAEKQAHSGFCRRQVTP
jgi:UDP-glucuronate 4-epimerase